MDSNLQTCLEIELKDYRFGEFDVSKLEGAINKSFSQVEKELVPGYFLGVGFKKPVITLVKQEGEYAGGSISYPMQADGVDFQYLCKLFVQEEYGGMGIASSLIKKLISGNGAVVWRTSASNCSVEKHKNIISHYDGNYFERDPYVVFTVGIDEPSDELVDCIASVAPTVMDLRDEYYDI
mgnify:CR=1 FL=1